MMTRPLSELIDTADPAWPALRHGIEQARNLTTIVAPNPAAEDDLLKLQVTTHSTLGAIVLHTGGLLIDHGWVRLLGSKSARMSRSLVDWNESHGRKGLLLVGDDVLGGLFAINGGWFTGPLGNAHYFAPDALRWEDLGCGHTGLVEFLLQGDLDAFYGDSRWTGWRADVTDLPGDQGFSIHPPLFTKADRRDRRPAPLQELIGLYGALS